MKGKEHRRIWELKQSADPGVLELYIYGDVEEDGYDWQTGETIESETSATNFHDELTKYPEAREIILYINSYGGSVFEGTAIYNQLRRHPAKKTVYIDGFACSVASVIAMAGDRVVMPRNAMMMIHNAWMHACGNAEELRKAADDLDAINKGNRQAYLQKAGDKLTEDDLVSMLDAETWLTAEDCVRLGLADEYAEKGADIEAASAVLQKARLNLEQRIQLQKSLAAQLRQLAAPLPAPEPTPQRDPAPPADPEPEPEPQSSGLMQTLFRTFCDPDQT